MNLNINNVNMIFPIYNTVYILSMLDKFHKDEDSDSFQEKFCKKHET